MDDKKWSKREERKNQNQNQNEENPAATITVQNEAAKWGFASQKKFTLRSEGMEETKGEMLFRERSYCWLLLVDSILIVTQKNRETESQSESESDWGKARSNDNNNSTERNRLI